jgi:hypothetical protein
LDVLGQLLSLTGLLVSLLGLFLSTTPGNIRKNIYIWSKDIGLSSLDVYILLCLILVASAIFLLNKRIKLFIIFLKIFSTNIYRLRFAFFQHDFYFRNVHLCEVYVDFRKIQSEEILDFTFTFFNPDFEKIEIIGVSGYFEFEKDQNVTKLDQISVYNPWNHNSWQPRQRLFVHVKVYIPENVRSIILHDYGSVEPIKIRLEKLSINLQYLGSKELQTARVWPVIHCYRSTNSQRTDVCQVNEMNFCVVI